MSEYDFSMYLSQDEDGLPIITIQVIGLEDMDEAENLANELFAIISEGEPGQLH